MLKKDIKAIIKELKAESKKARSYWKKGVIKYALELVEYLPEQCNFTDICNATLLKKALLNGAYNWQQYSDGGSALIYDQDIAERLCSPSELKKTRGGERNPNSRENWLDCQARALYQAEKKIMNIYYRLKGSNIIK